MKTTVVSPTGVTSTLRANVATEQTGSRQQNAIQDNYRRETEPLRTLPFAAGLVVFERVSLPANQQVTIQHRLGRVAKGWLVVAPTEFASYKQFPGTTDELRTQIVIAASASTVVDLWVW